MKQIISYLFLAVLFIYGVWLVYDAWSNNLKFINSYKRIDFIKLFGDFGRILYILFGIIVCGVAVFLFYRL